MYYYILYYINTKSGAKDCIITHKLSRRNLNKLIAMLKRDNIIVVEKRGFKRVCDARMCIDTSDFDYDYAIKQNNIKL